jgi:hypothetical protein
VSASATWNSYRRSRRRFLAVWLGGLCIISLLLAITHTFNMPAVAVVLGPLALATFVVGFLASAYALTLFPCPRCREPFFSRFPFYSNPFRSTCVACGLHKWSAPDA